MGSTSINNGAYRLSTMGNNRLPTTIIVYRAGGHECRPGT